MGGILDILGGLINSKPSNDTEMGLVAIIATLSTKQKAEIRKDGQALLAVITIAKLAQPNNKDIAVAEKFANLIVKAAK